MQPIDRKAIAQRISPAREDDKATGFVELAIVSLLGLALTLILIAHYLFPALP